VLAIDNHELHLQEHQNRMKSPTFMSQPPQVQQAYMQHIQEHEQFQAMAAQAQMLQAQAMGGPGAPVPTPAAPPEHGMPPQGHHPSQAGNAHQGALPNQVKTAINGADLLNPATIEGRK
jgi:hypothetical protein